MPYDIRGSLTALLTIRQMASDFNSSLDANHLAYDLEDSVTYVMPQERTRHTACSRLLFPAPTRPIKATRRPRGTSKLRFRSANASGPSFSGFAAATFTSLSRPLSSIAIQRKVADEKRIATSSCLCTGRSGFLTSACKTCRCQGAVDV